MKIDASKYPLAKIEDFIKACKNESEKDPYSPIGSQDGSALLADLVLEAQCRAPEEIHDLARLVCWRSDAEAAGHTDAAAKIERALRAFVARRKLGTPVTIKGVRAEFLDSANGRDQRPGDQNA